MRRVPRAQLDLAAVKAAHEGHVDFPASKCVTLRGDARHPEDPRCLVYLLAVEAERLAWWAGFWRRACRMWAGYGQRQRERAEAAEGAVARAEALAKRWEHGAVRWADPLPVPPQVGELRAALADRSEQPENRLRKITSATHGLFAADQPEQVRP